MKPVALYGYVADVRGKCKYLDSRISVDGQKIFCLMIVACKKLGWFNADTFVNLYTMMYILLYNSKLKMNKFTFRGSKTFSFIYSVFICEGQLL